jgi:hypothetical protein
MATMFPNVPTQQGYRAPGPYDENYRSIARREQMAQILQQQALQPIDVGSYQGIQAPISPLSGIAKILQGYFAGQQMEKADEGRQDLLFKSENADRALVGLPPIERTKPQQLAQALQQPAPTMFGEGMPAVNVPQAQTMPIAQSFPIGPSGADQNLPPNQEISMPPQVAPTQTMPTQGVAPQGQFRPPGGGPALPSVTGDPAKDLALLKQFRGDTAAYVKFAYEQTKPTAVGNFAIDRNGKVIFAAPSKEGYVDVQGPTGSFSRKEVPGAIDLETSRATGVEYAKGAAGSAVKRDEETFGVAQTAQTNIDRANEIIDLVNAGALTGTAAEIKLKLARALNIGGADNNEVIKNTEVLVSRLGQNVLGNIKASGLGAGQGFTDTDRAFLERIVGGSIDLNPKTLQDLARISKSVSAAAVAKWNQRLPDIAPNIAKDLGLRPIKLNNVYSRSEIEAELKRRGLRP